jgi:hypothetical protein
VKIRYKLVQRITDTGTQYPTPGPESQSTQFPDGMILSSEGGKVVIETTNGTLTAGRIEFGTNTMTAMGGVSITYTNSVPGR